MTGEPFEIENADAAISIRKAGCITVYDLFREQAKARAGRCAIEYRGRSSTYSELAERVERVASLLVSKGIQRGDRIAVLSENRPEYLEVQLAAAKLGAVVACQNWRLTIPELEHCINLVSPSIIIHSERHGDAAKALKTKHIEQISFGTVFEDALRNVFPGSAPQSAEAEDGLIILYTSGTTGRPKAAVISHRAEIARMMVLRLDLGVDSDDAYLAWSPMFHMGGTDHSLSTLMMGGAVILTDGLDVADMAKAIGNHKLGWLLLVPATIDPLMEVLQAEKTIVKGVKVVGCMADLVPTTTISAISGLLDAAFFNSFGSTETGLPPASAHLILPGTKPQSLSKWQSSLCLFRLVDKEGKDCATGQTGQGLMKGPTLFSGYWNAPEINAAEFRGGWFHMGDLFCMNPDNSFDFVGRAKYLIKSGGENIYPAEIERVLLSDARISEAVVVRQVDKKWGEIPVAVVSRFADNISAEEIEQLCRRELASYKRPKAVHFIDFDKFPRSATGKIIREDVEKLLSLKD